MADDDESDVWIDPTGQGAHLRPVLRCGVFGKHRAQDEGRKHKQLRSIFIILSPVNFSSSEYSGVVQSMTFDIASMAFSPGFVRQLFV
jgi:hypothetical protein